MDKTGFSHLVEIKDLKLRLLNKVCALMIHEPRYYAPEPSKTQADLSQLLTEIAARDPEFVWKVILYVRDELNIRSTANWMMAVAANLKPCHAFFERYFSSCVRLPSDLLDVVNLYLDLPNRYLPDSRSLPAALRTAVQHKFLEFDDYQLAKYNKENAHKKKAKLAKAKAKADATAAARTPDAVSTATSATPKKGGRPPQESPSAKPQKLTLKQLIRKVHVAEPANAVCALLGKKYPESPEAFAKMGLAGEFDTTLAGKRMKLPVPVTWETQLSALGNQHSTWQMLIDEKKLPFMAMLRNLRNLIVTGISPEHHEQILARLTDERSVTGSRQLPWRFLSAHQAIDIDLEKLMNDMLDHDGSKYKVVQVPVKGKKGRQMAANRTIRKRVIIPVHMPDLPLIRRYQEAIDTAIRLATLHNLPPVEGRTVIFCDVSGSMRQPCRSCKGGLGTGIQQAFEIAILLGLMLQSCCDEVDFRIFSSPPRNGSKCHLSVPLVENTILKNVKRVTKQSEELGGGTDFPFDYLEDLIARKEKIDNFIILSDMMIAPGRGEMAQGKTTVSAVLDKYRREVNPDLLFVSVDLCGSGSALVEVSEGKHPNDMLISGFSDGILKFIAQRGATNKQLEYVESIGQAKRLGYKKPRRPFNKTTAKNDVGSAATAEAEAQVAEGDAMQVAAEETPKGKEKDLVDPVSA
ncbi:TROVE domain containing protein [Acanthamoeba castellanii str. Neff]|uniref:TROVE domain containing protein n=1 Tax=Acanthamoeba castellanii (strain ATCC 30010 / Neff) TaxID=1257118 RepID=L8GW11_ACACF|nr:TROVE domain containing protein [Acanthamoeba castellanii str. Neff]ELR16276.1 TROVE domain containing protein [Acanthamoeba castellanii str. Neff]